jgi:uncharacterized protein YgfB (UPF0149 family)
MNTQNTSLPEYNTVTTALRRVDSQISSAECHGLISGALNTENTAAIARFFSDDKDLLQNDEEFSQLVAQLVQASSEGYADESFNFQLLLPNDDVPLLERSRALAEWCGGYLMGLLESGLKEFDKLPEDAAEVAKDLVEISQLDASIANSGSDGDLMQLEEYVRMGVQIINIELAKEKSKLSNSQGNSAENLEHE